MRLRLRRLDSPRAASWTQWAKRSSSTWNAAEADLRRAFAEKVAVDPIGALEGIRETGRAKPLRFKVRPR